MREQTVRWGRVALLCSLLAVCLFCVGGSFAAPAAHAGEYKSSDVTWVTKNSKVFAKVDGKKLTGLQRIGTKTYYFDKKGVQRTGWRKVKGACYFFQNKNKQQGYMLADTVVNGVRLRASGKAAMTAAAREELNILLKSNALLDSITKPTWGKMKKLRACWKYFFNQKKVVYRAYRKWSYKKNWHHAYALDVFVRHGGNCFSMGAAFAYLGNSIGFAKCEAVSSGGHGWARIDGLVYDPDWARVHSGDWFGVKGAYRGVNYAANSAYVAVINPNTTADLAATSNKGSAKGATGLVKKNGTCCYYVNGSKLKSSWKTIGGKRYYFQKDGTAAVGAVKIKGTWYVFDSKARLSKGTKVHLCKVKGAVYRVKASGKAKGGYNDSKTKRYSASGQLMCGIWVVSGKFYAASRAGVYNAEKTAALRAATTVNASVGALLDLLPTPKKTTYADSCNTGPSGLGGKDGIYTYAHFTLYTFRDTAGAETLVGIEAS